MLLLYTGSWIVWPPKADSRVPLCLVPFFFPVTKQDIEEHFSTHGTGKITEIKLMNGFGFIEYEDALDAKDVVPGEEHFRGRIISPWNF